MAKSRATRLIVEWLEKLRPSWKDVRTALFVAVLTGIGATLFNYYVTIDDLEIEEASIYPSKEDLILAENWTPIRSSLTFRAYTSGSYPISITTRVRADGVAFIDEQTGETFVRTLNDYKRFVNEFSADCNSMLSIPDDDEALSDFNVKFAHLLPKDENIKTLRPYLSAVVRESAEQKSAIDSLLRQISQLDYSGKFYFKGTVINYGGTTGLLKSSGFVEIDEVGDTQIPVRVAGQSESSQMIQTFTGLGFGSSASGQVNAITRSIPASSVGEVTYEIDDPDAMTLKRLKSFFKKNGNAVIRFKVQLKDIHDDAVEFESR